MGACFAHRPRPLPTRPSVNTYDHFYTRRRHTTAHDAYIPQGRIAHESVSLLEPLD